jgi:uncharacterized protein (DUF983 family)
MIIRNAPKILLRSLRLRCPSCGQGSLYKSVFKMEKECSHCEMIFEREHGYFVGAIYINVVATELLLGIIYFTYFLISPSSHQSIDSIMVVLALILPAIFYHHARSLWLSFDHIIEPLQNRAKPGLL